MKKRFGCSFCNFEADEEDVTGSLRDAALARLQVHLLEHLVEDVRALRGPDEVVSVEWDILENITDQLHTAYGEDTESIGATAARRLGAVVNRHAAVETGS